MHSPCPPWVLPESASDVPHVAKGLIGFQSFIYRNAKTHILSHGDLKTWHEKIFQKVVPLSYYAGHYRSDDPTYPCLRAAAYIDSLPGAPYPEVPRLMRELSDEMHDFTVQTDKYVASNPTPANRARAVVQLAGLYVGKFIQIHPFINGNGRMSRLIANYVFYRYGYPMPHFNPYPRPGIGYVQASAACMVGNYSPMFQYLLAALARRA